MNIIKYKINMYNNCTGMLHLLSCQSSILVSSVRIS